VVIERPSKEQRFVEFVTAVFDQELPDKRCVDLEYLLFTLPPRSAWVITVEDANTSLGEDLGGEAGESRKPCGGQTRIGEFTGRRRL
jgi:hypothetical protein